MRIGLIGTGFWARTVHAASAASLPSVEFVGVWGRNRTAAAELAAEFGIDVYDDPDELIDNVDALTFAVPPDVQAEIAIRAARGHRHLLLEKPVSLSPGGARELERAVEESHVASVVFFTQRFVEASQRWLEGACALSGWVGGRAEFLSNIFGAGSPYAESAWRREHGALWDVGPHALSLLWPVLGPVTAIVAGRGAGDHVNLIVKHASGASSTLSLSLTAPSATVGRTVYVDGDSGRLVLPATPLQPDDLVRTHQAALQTLINLSAQSDPAHACDVHFGARVVEALAAAEQSLEQGCWVDLN
jgi:predicted dehydrogenase